MGLTFTKLFARLFSKKEMRILMVSSLAKAAFRSPTDYQSLPAPVGETVIGGAVLRHNMRILLVYIESC